MPVEVNYEFPFTSIAISGEINVGTITAAAAHALYTRSVQITMTGTPSSTDPPVTYRVKRGTAAGTGTAVTGQRTDPNNTQAFSCTGQKGTFSVAPTAASASPQAGASLASTQPFYTERPLGCAPGDCFIFTVERNGAGATASGVVYVTVVEYP